MQPVPFESKVHGALRGAAPALGTFTLMSDPWVVEVVGRCGYDFICIDLEHAARDLSETENLIRAADAVGISPIVRVPELDRKLIARLMDSGAHGILLPLVEDAETARGLRESIAYPPRGKRPTCSMVRAASFGLMRGDFATYVESVNRQTLAIALVETLAGLERLDAILAEDIDVVLLGRADLSADLGLYYDVHNDEVVARCHEAIETIRGHGRSAGILAYSTEEAAEWIAAGCRFIIYSQPELVLASSFRDARESLARVSSEVV